MFWEGKRKEGKAFRVRPGSPPAPPVPCGGPGQSPASTLDPRAWHLWRWHWTSPVVMDAPRPLPRSPVAPLGRSPAAPLRQPLPRRPSPAGAPRPQPYLCPRVPARSLSRSAPPSPRQPRARPGSLEPPPDRPDGFPRFSGRGAGEGPGPTQRGRSAASSPLGTLRPLLVPAGDAALRLRAAPEVPAQSQPGGRMR